MPWLLSFRGTWTWLIICRVEKVEIKALSRIQVTPKCFVLVHFCHLQLGGRSQVGKAGNRSRFQVWRTVESLPMVRSIRHKAPSSDGNWRQIGFNSTSINIKKIQISIPKSLSKLLVSLSFLREGVIEITEESTNPLLTFLNFLQYSFFWREKGDTPYSLTSGWRLVTCPSLEFSWILLQLELVYNWCNWLTKKVRIYMKVLKGKESSQPVDNWKCWASSCSQTAINFYFQLPTTQQFVFYPLKTE